MSTLTTALIQSSPPSSLRPALDPLSWNALANLAPVEGTRYLGPDPPMDLGIHLSQYGTNFSEGPGSPTIPGLDSKTLGLLLSIPDGVEEDSTSVGMDVLPPSSPRSPAVVYLHSSGSPPPALALWSPTLVLAPSLELVTVFPNTHVAVPKDRPPRSPRLTPLWHLCGGRFPENKF